MKKWITHLLIKYDFEGTMYKLIDDMEDIIYELNEEHGIHPLMKSPLLREYFLVIGRKVLEFQEYPGMWLRDITDPLSFLMGKQGIVWWKKYTANKV